MEIQITQKQCGGTEFLARPHRLHLGAQNAAGVDQLHFILPEAWAGCSAALYLRRADGTLLAPVSLDGEGRVTVARRLTGSTGGQWMLAAIRGEDYTAYTRPGSYDTYAILPTDGGTEELPPSLYEQFVARVLESASTASTAAQRAAASAASCTANAAQAQTAAQRAETGRTYKELLQKHRMETAARLLRRSDMNIQQIISLVGYENTSYFYRLFHERYGLSPREYRQVRAARVRTSA